MGKLLSTLLLLLFCFCSEQTHPFQVRNRSGEALGNYPKNIRWLGFQEEPDWKDLEVFSDLEILELISDRIGSLHELPRLPKLRYLNITSSKVKDLSPLNRIEKLDSLVMNNVEITDSQLRSYEGWNRLTRLEVIGSKISNLEFLGPDCRMRRLYIKRTSVSDLTPLRNCRNLQELYLEGTQTKDLSPLYPLSGLVHLQLDGTKVSEDEIRNIRRELPYLKIIPGLRKILSSETGLSN